MLLHLKNAFALTVGSSVPCDKLNGCSAESLYMYVIESLRVHNFLNFLS